MRTVAGWSFESPLKMQDILTTLNRATEMLGANWLWHQRESDWKGTYLICHPVRENAEVYMTRATAAELSDRDFNSVKIRIIEDKGKFFLDINFHSEKEGAEAEAEYANHVRTIHESILPLLSATSIEDADYWD